MGFIKTGLRTNYGSYLNLIEKISIHKNKGSIRFFFVLFFRNYAIEEPFWVP